MIISSFFIPGCCQDQQTEVDRFRLLADICSDQRHPLFREDILKWEQWTSVNRPSLSISVKLIDVSVLVGLDETDIVEVNFVFRVRWRLGIPF